MSKRRSGLTIIEIVIVIVIIAILATIAIVSYNGVRNRAIHISIASALTQASDKLELALINDPSEPNKRSYPGSIPSEVIPPEDVQLVLKKPAGQQSYYYPSLSDVQNGVLFEKICKELMNEPAYSKIHSKDGKETYNVVLKCDDNTRAGGIHITAWKSKDWPTNIEKSDLQDYINSVPYDSYWTDRQSVVQGFYNELINRFESRGGDFPITSFCDSWADQWSGTVCEDLPSPKQQNTSNENTFCIQALYPKNESLNMYITSHGTPKDGECPESY